MNIQLDLFAPPPVDPVAHHIKMMRSCWPEWDGPKVGCRCQVAGCFAWSITHNSLQYRSAAPCKLIAEESGEWIACIDYPETSWCAKKYNGEILRLPITNIWPPVQQLIATRKEAA